MSNNTFWLNVQCINSFTHTHSTLGTTFLVECSRDSMWLIDTIKQSTHGCSKQLILAYSSQLTLGFSQQSIRVFNSYL